MGNPRGNPIEQSLYVDVNRPCICCGEIFTRNVNTKQAPYTKFCSRKCMYKLRRLKSYGITFAELNERIKEQNESCAICKIPFNKLDPHSINIDHDHRTGKVRGILCLNCNQGLGQFKDNSTNLRIAAEYLENN